MAAMECLKNWYGTTAWGNHIFEILRRYTPLDDNKYLDGSKYHETGIHGLGFVHGI